MAHDALGAHVRDELGIMDALRERPLQAALASAASFTVGATLPVVITAVAPPHTLIITVGVNSLASLTALGGVAARVGGAANMPSFARAVFWGAMAKVVTAGVGSLFGPAG